MNATCPCCKKSPATGSPSKLCVSCEERDDIFREEGLAEQEEFDRPRREYADAHVGRY